MITYILTGNNFCPDPWVKSENQNGNWYYFSEEYKGTFSQATKFCETIGGYVVNLSSEEVYDSFEYELGTKYSLFIMFHCREKQ